MRSSLRCQPHFFGKQSEIPGAGDLSSCFNYAFIKPESPLGLNKLLAGDRQESGWEQAAVRDNKTSWSPVYVCRFGNIRVDGSTSDGCGSCGHLLKRPLLTMGKQPLIFDRVLHSPFKPHVFGATFGFGYC